ncbi:putative protein kinase RLK-Pelle-CrRLK1L-1 family [Helianthus annuus]|nr:putative protein kinase RLK-Pelle-CrRLK1L-1 family [Helianthus annuus]
MPTKIIKTNFLSLTLFLSLISTLSIAFTPPDNFLVNCGSNTNLMFAGREFVSDNIKPGSGFLSSHKSITLSNPNPNPDPDLFNIYTTARVFTSVSNYRFNLNKTGTHFVRLHFAPFNSTNYNLPTSNFSVLVNGASILTNFATKSTLVKEFILMVLETVYRINVGGLKLTPFNDTLWRNWVPDEEFLLIKSSAKSVVTTHVPNYQKGGATKEVAPDNVYMTAQEMNRGNLSINSVFNLTWGFPVDSDRGVRYFVRLHFCDIVSLSLNQLYFNVYVNRLLAYKDLDLSLLSFHVLASPFYADFVVDSDGTGVLEISVGPSDLSTSLRKNAILNGVEVMKIVKPAGGRFSREKNSVWGLVVLIVGGLIVTCCLVLAMLIVLKLRKKTRAKTRRVESNGWTPLRVHGSTHSKFSEGTNNVNKLKIPFVDLQAATNNFDKSLIIGSGGFGIVYKGVLRDNLQVAVKRCVSGSRQGLPEFRTEITILSKIRHRHLVALVGYCEEDSEMILVYEYMGKGPLKSHLYGSNLPPLSWKQRLEICIGAARGIHYLHTGSTQGIIHRDVKSTNILLDETYLAKVSDFGLSRSGPCMSETHVSTNVKGSFGYLDPEYFRLQQLTDKSDVYSFGVVLFEVLCARPVVDPLLGREEINLGEWAVRWQKKGLLKKIVDPRIVDEIKPESLATYGNTAEKCLAEYGVDRPTMGDVLWNLEHALQLQEAGSVNATSVGQTSEPNIIAGVGSSNVC